MTTGTPSRNPMTIRLKAGVFDRLASLHGWKSDTEVARAIGISRPQVQRIRSGEQPPSVAFIASFLHAVPGAGFHETFEIVPTQTKEETDEV